MKSFKRIFKYIWPQWPRIIVVVVSAMVVSALLSLSFMTLIPMLDVMLGREGLHGWVDRKSCGWKYGLDLFVPETTRVAGDAAGDALGRVIVKGVAKNSLAEAAGLKSEDRIYGAGEYPVSEDNQKVPCSKILQQLAAATENEISIRIRRPNKQEIPEDKTLVLNTPYNTVFVGSLQWSELGRLKSNGRVFLAERLQHLVSFLPRPDGRADRTKAVIYIILAVGVITIIRCLAKFCQDYIAQTVVQVGINHLREDAFGRAVDVPMSFFANERPSDTVSRIVRDTSVMGKAIKMMLGKALREPLNAGFMLGCAMLLNWQLTLVFICAAPLVVGLLAVFGRKMKRATRKSLVASSRMLAKLQETMSGLRIVKVYNRQEYEREAFKKINDSLLKQLLKISKVDAATMPVLEVLGMLAGSGALIAGVYWIVQDPDFMEGSEFLTLLVLLGVAAEAVRKTSDIWNRIQEANAAAERVFGVVDEPVEPEKAGAIELSPLKEKIEFQDVTFGYPGADRPALRNINLVVQAGHNIAIVGPNGSGKTTLANLMPRFYDADSGRILIDGTDISEVTLSSLRGQIGMVSQNIVTFNDTIAANIAYGKCGATREEVIAAARRSFADEFISSLPAGYDTVIGEYGAGLSGGQLQRIVIARAILKNPAVLIFDEATSQVDADSEAKIHKAIEQTMRERTSIIIAHRFSTVISADVIVVMDQGQIIAQGQHDELMQTCPLYQSLYETQLVKA
jgi:ABC-type multidrug transport system fused ATPase/permease subunit